MLNTYTQADPMDSCGLSLFRITLLQTLPSQVQIKSQPKKTLFNFIFFTVLEMKFEYLPVITDIQG